MMLAADNGHTDTVKELAAKGANVDLLTKVRECGFCCDLLLGVSLWRWIWCSGCLSEIAIKRERARTKERARVKREREVVTERAREVD